MVTLAAISRTSKTMDHLSGRWTAVKPSAVSERFMPHCQRTDIQTAGPVPRIRSRTEYR